MPGHTIRQIAHKRLSKVSVTAAYRSRRNQLGIRAKRRPSPNVAIPKLALFILWDILLLGITEGPDFIHLDPLTGKFAKGVVLVIPRKPRQRHRAIW
jgi:hypothetical protein